MKTLRTYTLGFILSVVLTVLAFVVVGFHLDTEHVFPSHQVLVPFLVLLALIQMTVQLVFFLHVGEEKEPRWNLLALLFALLIVLVVVGGTLWIMWHLSHEQMAQREVFVGGEITPQAQKD